ncbi:MAG: phosphoribosyltransferase family protein [Planctomycetota bacterium]
MRARAGIKYLDDVIEAWCGWEQPPVTRRWSRANWMPDHPSRYCHRCGESVGAGEVTVRGCAGCRGTRWPLDAVVRLGTYDDVLQTWVLGVKYGKDWTMGLALGRTLGEAVRPVITATEPVLVVPMPMPRGRRFRRGIDHAWVVGRGVGQSLGLRPRQVFRVSARIPQVERSAHERWREAHRGLRWRRGGKSRVKGKTIVLVDDVRTTGGSLAALARMARRGGALRVVGAVVAVRDTMERGGTSGGAKPVT